MGNFTSVRLTALALVLTAVVTAEGATQLPQTVGYTFFLGGVRVGQSETRIVQSPGVLRFESKLRVENGPNVVELSTRTEADPSTYAIRRFSSSGTKGGKPMSTNVTVEGDSVFGSVTVGKTTSKRGVRMQAPVVVWEDWTMDIQILLALQQARAGDRASTLPLLLASSYSVNSVTLGYTGEASVDGHDQSVVTRKLLVAILGGEPFESFIDPKRGIPVYIRFPGLQAEAFLDDFFGDNPVSTYPPKPAPPSDQ
jgi:hypothetical protein